MRNTKGLSTVVTTLIIILLVLVAIGIVWVVVDRLISNTEGQINVAQKCIGISLEITETTFVAGAIGSSKVTVTKMGGATPDGIQATFNGGVPESVVGEVTTINPSNVINTDTAMTSPPTSVTVAAYFDDADGNPYFCSQSVTSP